MKSSKRRVWTSALKNEAFVWGQGMAVRFGFGFGFVRFGTREPNPNPRTESESLALFFGEQIFEPVLQPLTTTEEQKN